MDRPQFKAKYEEDADLAVLAAAYLYALTTTQGFSDGNKRTAVAVTYYFLNKNGWELTLKSKLLYEFAMLVAKTSID